MPQLLCHIFGDYILQSDWMALNKSKRTLPCLVHVLLYTAGFLFLTTSWKALLVIGGVHFILDRFPIIIKRMIWAKNHINPTGDYKSFEQCNTTGYYDDSPYNTKPTGLWVAEGDRPRHFFITVWLYIITDNFLHLLTNYLALAYLT
jgi:hypothetical protein